MFDFLTNFFDWISSIITSAFNFLMSIITGTVQLLGMVPTVVQMLLESISYLPPIVIAFATASVSILVVYLILGRSRS